MLVVTTIGERSGTAPWRGHEAAGDATVKATARRTCRANHGRPQRGVRRRAGPPPYDPLRLCVFATVALLGWLLGPVALTGFAVLGFAGYWRARRAGLLRSRCLLGDTRLVLGYLGLLVVAGLVGTWWWIR